jgi:two-component system, chemotaxis family, protein-glutamate methylesterase/glutaminase
MVVIGASAGGISALQQLARALPAALPATLFVTVHFPKQASSALPRILARAGAVAVTHAIDGEMIERARIYVAPPDSHLVLAPDVIRLGHGPREHGNRPAIDPMFRSAALAFGRRVIGVVLTGTLYDGTSGLALIKQCGGLAVVQDPVDAEFSSMPQSAMDHVAVDRIVPIQFLGRTLVDLVAEQLSDSPASIARDLANSPSPDVAMLERDHPPSA